jgi:hypothetical protein
MRGRVAVFLSLLVISPALSQQMNVTQRINQRYAAHEQNMRPEAAPEIDQRAIRLREINQDAQTLSALSSSLQSDLQQLQKGFLAKDLNQKLKNIEKLSKRLRREMIEPN